MTTQNVITLAYRTALTLLVFTIGVFAVSAQENTQVLEDESILSVETEATSTIAEDVVSTAPWYKLEKLSGTVDQGDFVVGPGRAEIEVKPGQTVVYEISVSNRISDGRRFELVVEDIAGSDDASRAMVFLGEERGPHTIKDYISFPENSFTLNLGERARVPVTISIPADAEPGGYYGGVLVSTVKDEGDNGGAGTARSPIVARIGTLFFITVPGEVVKGGETKDFSLARPSWWFEKGPIDMRILYENTGSVHVNPYGEVRITNLFGEEVGFVELEPWFVLPKSLRTRDISWDRELLFGRYTATALVNRGYDDIVDEFSFTFWVLPWKVVGGIFLGIFIILFTLRFFFRTFEFKRRG